MNGDFANVGRVPSNEQERGYTQNLKMKQEHNTGKMDEEAVESGASFKTI